MIALLATLVFVTIDGVPREDFRARFPHLREGAADFEAADPSLLSLPEYQAIFAGRLTGCASNECGPTKFHTFVEGLSGAALFATWKGIRDAVGAVPVEVSPTDLETASRAMQCLLREHPRFLYVALDDADELAHRGDREAYLAALAFDDAWLGQLLEKTGATVIVTTDHGRGSGDRWREHGPQTPEAKQIWLFMRPLVEPAPKSHLDLRPLIERLLR